MKNNYRFFKNNAGGFIDSTVFVAGSTYSGFTVSRDSSGFSDDSLRLSDCLRIVNNGSWEEISLVEALSLIPESEWATIIKRLNISDFTPVKVDFAEGHSATVYSDRVVITRDYLSFKELHNLYATVKSVEQKLQ